MRDLSFNLSFQAFWDSLVSDLSHARPSYARVIHVVAEIKTGVSDLSSPMENATLNEVVDLDFIKQQAEAGIFGWTSCMQLVSSVMSIIQRICSPERDAVMDAKWKEIRTSMENAIPDERQHAFCSALRFLLECVNWMRIDSANSRLRSIATVILQHGFDYERGKFQDRLLDGTHTLERTTATVEKSIVQLIQSGQFSLDELMEGKATQYVLVHTQMLFSMVLDSNRPLITEACPETYLLDLHRIRMLQSEFVEVSTRSTMLVTAKYALASFPNARQALVDIAAYLSTKDMISYDENIDEVLEDLKKLMSSVQPATRDQLLHNWKRCSYPDDSVHRLMYAELFILSAMLKLTHCVLGPSESGISLKRLSKKDRRPARCVSPRRWRRSSRASRRLRFG